MRVICDAPGQTCNRLWTYVTSIAQCIAEDKRMIILFYDWTIEDFPNLLHAKFIYFPLWQPWFLRLPKGWGWYKHLTWKVTHNKTWDKIFNLLECKKGWSLMDDTRYLAQTKKELQHVFKPRKEICDKAERMITEIRKEANLVVGVHIRHGAYKTFYGGIFYYSLEEFHKYMLQIQELYSDKQVAFFISSNEEFLVDEFPGCKCYRFDKEPSGDILDLHMLSLCDRIIGPWSTYNRWAAFIGEVPLCCLYSKGQQLTKKDFRKVTDFYHFEDGSETVGPWRKQAEASGFDDLGHPVK